MTSPSDQSSSADQPSSDSASLDPTSRNSAVHTEQLSSDSAPAAASTPQTVRTKPNRHFPFLSRHPWVLATALAETKKPASDKSAETTPSNDEPAAGAPEANRISQQVDLLDHDGNWIARGLANPASRLRLRLYSFSRDQPIDDAFFAQRIDEAVARRRLARSTDHTGVQESGSKLAEMGERLIFSESDRLSGLIVDRYADCLSVQFTAAALLPRGKFLIDQVLNACEKHGTPCRRVIARMDPATAKHEGVAADQVAEVESWSRGISPTADGSDAATDDSSPMVWYRHNDLKMGIDLRDGQKTGGYLDQQANHAEAARWRLFLCL